MLILLSYLLFNALTSGAAAIYDVVGRYYGWQQMPKRDDGLFFGKSGCTRKALEYTIQVLRDSFPLWSTKTDSYGRNSVFAMIGKQVSEETGADASGIKTFCNWVYMAAANDRDVYAFLSGGDYSAWDNIKKVVSETVSEKAESIAETVEYGINYETKAESTISTLIPVIGILGACYLVKKIID